MQADRVETHGLNRESNRQRGPFRGGPQLRRRTRVMREVTIDEQEFVEPVKIAMLLARSFIGKVLPQPVSSSPAPTCALESLDWTAALHWKYDRNPCTSSVLYNYSIAV